MISWRSAEIWKIILGEERFRWLANLLDAYHSRGVFCAIKLWIICLFYIISLYSLDNMKINANGWTIVLAGNWNRHILSPEWAAKHIFDIEKLKIEFPLNIINFPPRFSSPDVAMMPSENAVIFMPLQQTDDCLLKAEQLAHNLIEKLPYTPISAFGVNFSFLDESPSDELMSLFNFNDIGGLTDFGFEVAENNIVRKLRLEDTTLNFSISNIEAGISFDFNFHTDVSDASTANERLRGKSVANKQLAYKMLSDIYHSGVQE